MYHCYAHGWSSLVEVCPTCHPTVVVTTTGVDIDSLQAKYEQLNPDAPWRDVAKQNIELEKELKKYKDIIEQLKDPLVWADEMLTARDEMNAKVHCSPVRLSEITLRIKAARKALEELKEL